MLADLVRDHSRPGSSRASDQRTFAASRQPTKQRSPSRRAAHSFRGIVVTLVVSILSSLRTVMFALGHGLRKTYLQGESRHQNESGSIPPGNVFHRITP
jgi:hypothetical protein